MNPIEILDAKIENDNRAQWMLFLTKERTLAESFFSWLKFDIDYSKRVLVGKGVLNSSNKSYNIELMYSPFFPYRYDRISVKHLHYNDSLHMYPDATLCLYHPVFDKPAFKHIELFRMIPWISEWIIFYEQWKKYGVWLGKEIKHLRSK